ncbi:MAG TPA: LemA family protein [Candidatus Paceibacterota bacterium]|nr:LemA family protein [Candidatus Paceibacterota bacterium]
MMIILAILIVLVLWAVLIYNGLITLRTRSGEAWADIEVQLKRRYDLIPNLVNTIKGSTNFEQSTLTRVVEARAKATSIQIDPNKVDATTMQKLSASQTELSSALGRLLVVSEQYPDLKSNQNFLSLQNELSDTENKIQAARRFYNGNVRDLNIKIESFPSNILANMFNFSKKEFFDLGDDDAAQNPVEVKF